jgi:hypothetical protein
MKNNIAIDTPVDKLLRTLPRGKADWEGWSVCYTRLQAASDRLASSPNTFLSDDHVEVMAVMVCGHEETMKALVLKCFDTGLLK